MSVQNVVPIHRVDVEIIRKISENFDLPVSLYMKSFDPQSQQDSSSGDHDWLYEVLWQSIH